MTSERRQRSQELLAGALERPAPERAEWIAGRCGGDEEIRREVESLLAAHEALPEGFQASGTVEVPPSVAEHAARAAVPAPAVSPGTRLGAYEIVSRIGAGGMGEVYRARDAKLARDVAVKVLSPSLAEDPEALARFEREARAVAALSHPNILAIFDFGREKSIAYAVMELLEGGTLRELLRTSGSIPQEQAIELALQILDGLAAAHGKGIVHRDLKPENLFLTSDGRVKILDFGLAKRDPTATPGKETSAETVTGHTTPGTIMGTLGYMSPEQLLGRTVDSRSDLFSFGVVLYELVTAQLPFVGGSGVAIADAILHAQPRSFGRAPTAEEFKRTIRKLLAKEPAKRFTTAQEVRHELARIRNANDPAARRRKRAIRIGITALVLLGLPAGVLLWRRGARERWVREVATPEVARLVELGKNDEAAVLARKAQAILPADPTLGKLWTKATADANINSVPPGADVFYRPYGSKPSDWEWVGTTPIKNARVPDSPALWRISKAGFQTAYMLDQQADQSWKLRASGSVPSEMTTVAGRDVRIPYPFVESPRVVLADFLIDRHEVTNGEFKRFMDAGGYSDRKYWNEPFVVGGRTLSWEEAIDHFRDATGRPGPATWEAGTFSKGQDRHPVAGVSWFEASAYAAFVHKSLPTAYHWVLASENDSFAPQIVAGSNFRGPGTRPVESEGALSGFGTYDMAGNVKEWCWNATSNGYHVTYGGGFGEPEYMFTQPHAQSPWDRRANFGFRCIRDDSPVLPAAKAVLDPVVIDFEAQKPVSEEVFETFKTLYGYDRSDLRARVEESRKTADWVYERVTLVAAYGVERFSVHLFLPVNAKPPYQAVVYVPGGSALVTKKFDPDGEVSGAIDFIPLSGRVLVFPILQSTFERKDEYKFAFGFKHPAMWRDHLQMWSKDLARSIEYLESRPDIDKTKLAYFGFSWGGGLAPVLLAVEDRFKTAVLLSGGFWVAHRLPQADPVNYVRHIKIPILMLNERYDTYFPVEASQRPMFNLLGTPRADKRQVFYDAGHASAPHRDVVRETLDWLDKYLGPVQR